MFNQRKELKERFNIFLPPAVGYRSPVLWNLIREHHVLPRYYPRAVVIFLINLINGPFRVHERIATHKKVGHHPTQQDPVFIVGHWRSGTTLLHNLLTQDKQMAYVSTYQSVFPETIFKNPGKFIFKSFMDFLIPSTRKGDNVRLNPDFPQEEEFALGAKVPLSLYYFWFFPEETQKFFNQAVLFQGVDQQLVERWFAAYKELLNKACLSTQGSLFLSKNPPNTGRIDMLLKHFPHAKFIHIYRNPVVVYLSTLKFLSIMMPNLEFNSITSKQLEDNIIHIYQQLYTKFFRDKSMIPSGQLVEVCFEDLEKNPLKQIQRVYEELDIQGFRESLPAFRSFLDISQGYKKNTHTISKHTLARILKAWNFTMKAWDYDVPDNVQIAP